MSNFLSGRRARNSIGVRPSTREVALDQFSRLPSEQQLILSWVRKVAAPETWRCMATVPRKLGDELRRYLGAEETWEEIQVKTEPLDDYDADELDLPDTTDEMLLLQYEPRRPDVDSLPGEVHRLCAYYEPEAEGWKSLQWSVPGAGSAVDTLRFRYALGRLGLDDSGVPDAFLVGAAGDRLVLDDAVTSGLGIRATSERIIAYGAA